MTKKEFLDSYYEKGEFETKVDAEKKIKLFLQIIEESLAKGENISFKGFGKFEVVERPARVGRNPQTGKEMKIEARKSVKFKAGKDISEKVNKVLS